MWNLSNDTFDPINNEMVQIAHNGPLAPNQLYNFITTRFSLTFKMTATYYSLPIHSIHCCLVLLRCWKEDSLSRFLKQSFCLNDLLKLKSLHYVWVLFYRAFCFSCLKIIFTDLCNWLQNPWLVHKLYNTGACNVDIQDFLEKYKIHSNWLGVTVVTFLNGDLFLTT